MNEQWMSNEWSCLSWAVLSMRWHRVCSSPEAPDASGRVLCDLGTPSTRGLCNLQGQDAKEGYPTWPLPQLLLHPVIYCSKPLSVDYKIFFNWFMALYFFCCQVSPLAQLALHSPWCFALALFMESPGIHSGIFSQLRWASQVPVVPARLSAPLLCSDLPAAPVWSQSAFWEHCLQYLGVDLINV